MITSAAEALFAMTWELRRRAYALGWARPRAVDAQVVSIGNLTVGGTGKTTLTLHLARAARRAGRQVAVVCKRYRPGPRGHGDEELLYRSALGEAQVFAGASKRDLAEDAARAGHDLILVDDGFSHWGLERDLDVVLLDASDLWGGGRLLPAGRLREPRRALQRADVIVVSRLEGAELEPRLRAEVQGYAPSATVAAGRHAVAGVTRRDGTTVVAGGAARVVTATGNPEAVAASAREAGYDTIELSSYPDHHWFTRSEVEVEVQAARAAQATVVLTAKDAVRWPADQRGGDVVVLEVEWAWIDGGAALEQRVLETGSRT